MTTTADLPPVDVDRLREERLARLQAAMGAHDLEACLLFSEPNTRYATGVTAMPIWSMSTFTRCSVVGVEGPPILFEHPNSIHRSRLRALDVRPMHGWEFFDDPAAEARVFAREAVAALREMGVRGDRVGIDRLGAPAFLALQAEGLTLVDAAPATQQAREIKTPQELMAFRRGGATMVEALAELEDAIEPGVTERDLLAVLAHGVLSRGAEYLATNTVCSGPNTNPWRAEATERAIEPGDLVYVDTDTVAEEGCFFCVSRTFSCPGEVPTSDRRATYRAAYEWLTSMTELVRPGVSCAELAASAPPIPDRYLAQRYECMIHSVGLEEESPSVCHPLDPQPNGDRIIQPDMVLVVETYMGEVGGDHGVKLGNVIQVTPAGAEVVAPYPYSSPLLAAT